MLRQAHLVPFVRIMRSCQIANKQDTRDMGHEAWGMGNSCWRLSAFGSRFHSAGIRSAGVRGQTIFMLERCHVRTTPPHHHLQDLLLSSLSRTILGET